MNNQELLKHAAINSEKPAPSKKTIGDVLDSLNEEQRNVVNYLIYNALHFVDQEKASRKDAKGEDDAE